MSEEIILHSGEFTDRMDNNIRVTFYKKDRPIPPPPPVVYTIYTDKSSLKYTYDGVGPTNITVWSYQGQAMMYGPSSEWYNCIKIGEEDISGSVYKKYIYKLEITNNPGNVRRLNLTCRIEGVDESVASKTIPVIQEAMEVHLVTMDKFSIFMEAEGGTTDVRVWSNTSDEVTLSNDDDWLTLTASVVSDSEKIYTVTVDENTGTEYRDASLVASLVDMPEITATALLRQEGTEPVVIHNIYTSTERISSGSEGGNVTVRIWSNTDDEVELSESESWLSLSYTGTATDKTYTVTFSSNTGEARGSVMTALLVDHPDKTVSIDVWQAAPSIEHHVYVSVNSIEEGYLGGQTQVRVWSDTGDEVYINNNYNWINASSDDTDVDDKTYTISVARNNGASRTATIQARLTGVDDVYENISITQDINRSISLSTKSLNMLANGNPVSVAISPTNVNYILPNGAEWLQVQEWQEGIWVISGDVNQSAERSADIRFYIEDVDTTVYPEAEDNLTVTQAAGEPEPPVPPYVPSWPDDDDIHTEPLSVHIAPGGGTTLLYIKPGSTSAMITPPASWCTITGKQLYDGVMIYEVNAPMNTSGSIRTTTVTFRRYGINPTPEINIVITQTSM